jgi:hypothetical protein
VAASEVFEFSGGACAEAGEGGFATIEVGEAQLVEGAVECGEGGFSLSGAVRGEGGEFYGFELGVDGLGFEDFEAGESPIDGGDAGDEGLFDFVGGVVAAAIEAEVVEEGFGAFSAEDGEFNGVVAVLEGVHAGFGPAFGGVGAAAASGGGVVVAGVAGRKRRIRVH